MKIYLTGSHCSGKSTLCHYISKKYKLPMITEVARTILSEKELQIDSLRCNINTVDDYQSSIFYRQLQEESKHESFVSDRSIIDNLAYASQHSNSLSKLLSAPELQPYLTILKDAKSILFFVRPSKATLQADGVREVLNWDGIVAIDAQIKLLHEMFGVRYFQINTDSMQERIRLIDSVISLC